MTIDKCFIAAAAAAVLSGGSVVHAADGNWAADKGWYIGAGAGRASIRGGDCTTFADDVFACSTRYTKTTSGKLFVGYQFMRFVAIEVSHLWLGEFVETVNGTKSGNPVNRSDTFKPRAFAVEAVGTLPIGKGFAFQGRLGGSAWRTAYSTVGATGYDANSVNYDLVYQFGAGVKYDFHRNVAARVEIQSFRIQSFRWLGGGAGGTAIGGIFTWFRPVSSIASASPMNCPTVKDRNRPQAVIRRLANTL